MACDMDPPAKSAANPLLSRRPCSRPGSAPIRILKFSFEPGSLLPPAAARLKSNAVHLRPRSEPRKPTSLFRPYGARPHFQVNPALPRSAKLFRASGAGISCYRDSTDSLTDERRLELGQLALFRIIAHDQPLQCQLPIRE